MMDVHRHLDFVAENPTLGHRRDDLTPHDVWFSKVYSYLIVYSYTQTQVHIIAVLHMARDAEEILKDRP